MPKCYARYNGAAIDANINTTLLWLHQNMQLLYIKKTRMTNTDFSTLRNIQFDFDAATNQK